MINFITTRLVQLSTYVILWYVTALSSDIFWCHNVISIVRLHLGVHCHFSLVSCSHQPYQLFGGPTYILYQGRWIQSYNHTTANFSQTFYLFLYIVKNSRCGHIPSLQNIYKQLNLEIYYNNLFSMKKEVRWINLDFICSPISQGPFSCT